MRDKKKWHNFICSERSDQNNKNAKSGRVVLAGETGGFTIANIPVTLCLKQMT